MNALAKWVADIEQGKMINTDTLVELKAKVGDNFQDLNFLEHSAIPYADTCLIVLRFSLRQTVG